MYQQCPTEYMIGVPVINLLSLNPQYTLFVQLCDTAARPCRHFSFASQFDVNFCQQMVIEEQYKATPGKKGLSVPSFLCRFPLGTVEGGEGTQEHLLQ